MEKKESALFTDNEIEQLNSRFENTGAEEILIWSVENFGDEIALGTGFGASGVILIHMVYKLQLPMKIFCLDTNLLFDETYALWKQLELRYGKKIESAATALSLSEQAAAYGNNLWKTDPDRCCHIRKVLPLQRYLSDKKAWISGIRKSQTEHRRNAQKIERDALNNVIKINPLLNWTDSMIWDTIHQNDIPYHRLYDEGYPSIGCRPCTAPANGNGSPRAGRWENLEKTECGIHLNGHHLKSGSR
ncbi:MAG: phosphoadenylyl-sulfate reductase [Balneolaceae bacterium]|nr:phosphoadenylyl-sulfate reductase [Balneolaceae bacterium]